MKISTVLKVFAIILMAVGLLVLASWAGTFWAGGIDALGRLLPSGNEPITAAIRPWLPTVKSAGTIIVLVMAAVLGLGFGRRIWTA